MGVTDWTPTKGALALARRRCERCGHLRSARTSGSESDPAVRLAATRGPRYCIEANPSYLLPQVNLALNRVPPSKSCAGDALHHDAVESASTIEIAVGHRRSAPHIEAGHVIDVSAQPPTTLIPPRIQRTDFTNGHRGAEVEQSSECRHAASHRPTILMELRQPPRAHLNAVDGPVNVSGVTSARFSAAPRAAGMFSRRVSPDSGWP